MNKTIFKPATSNIYIRIPSWSIILWSEALTSSLSLSFSLSFSLSLSLLFFRFYLFRRPTKVVACWPSPCPCSPHVLLASCPKKPQILHLVPPWYHVAFEFYEGWWGDESCRKYQIYFQSVPPLDKEINVTVDSCSSQREQSHTWKDILMYNMHVSNKT